MEIRDNRGVENVVADHLSRLKGTRENSQATVIHEHFPDEQIMGIKDYISWFANFVNYLACHVLLPDLTSQQHKKFLHDTNHYLWDIYGMIHSCSVDIPIK